MLQNVFAFNVYWYYDYVRHTIQVELSAQYTCTLIEHKCLQGAGGRPAD